MTIIFLNKLRLVKPIQQKIHIDKKMKEEQNSDEISFQIYIDAVKEKKIPWNTFVKLMKDFYYPDLERLEHLNSMMLMELTKSYSYLERSRYLNAILLNELKNSIVDENVVEKEPIEYSQDSASIDHEFKDKGFGGETLNNCYSTMFCGIGTFNSIFSQYIIFKNA